MVWQPKEFQQMTSNIDIIIFSCNIQTTYIIYNIMIMWDLQEHKKSIAWIAWIIITIVNFTVATIAG